MVCKVESGKKYRVLIASVLATRYLLAVTDVGVVYSVASTQSDAHPAPLTHEFVLKEVVEALYAHRKLLGESRGLESECTTLDRLSRDRRLVAPAATGTSAPARGGGGGKPSPGSPRKTPAAASNNHTPQPGSAKNSASPAAPPAFSPKSQKVSPARSGVVGKMGGLQSTLKTPEERAVADSFDVRLHSIITSALIGDDNELDTKDVKIVKNVKDAMGSMGLPKGKLPLFDLETGQRKKHPSESGSGAGAPAPGAEKTDTVIKREKESPKGKEALHQLSLPVKIPLKDMGRKQAAGLSLVPGGNPPPGAKHHHHHHHHGHHSGVPTVGSPPAMREAYSPISRPSSSSSTASADSVKGLAHGATRRSTSPRTPHSAASSAAMVNAFNIDSIVSEAQRTGGRFVPPLPHAHKDSYSGPLSPGAHHHHPHHKPSAGPGGGGVGPPVAHPPHHIPGPYAGMYPPGTAPPTAAHFNPAILSMLHPPSAADKEAFAHLQSTAKQMLMNSSGTPPYLIPTSHPYYRYAPPSAQAPPNGLRKDAPLLPMEKPKRGKRRRSNSSSGGGGKSGGLPEAKRASPGDRPTPPAGGQHPEIVTAMMSTASQPLPIQSLPGDPEAAAHKAPGGAGDGVMRHGPAGVDTHGAYQLLSSLGGYLFTSGGAASTVMLSECVLAFWVHQRAYGLCFDQTNSMQGASGFWTNECTPRRCGAPRRKTQLV